MISKAAVARMVEEANLSIANRDINGGFAGMLETWRSNDHKDNPMRRRDRNTLDAMEAAERGEFIPGIGGIFTVGLAAVTGHDVFDVLEWYRKRL